jgi:hypothetical protein
MNYYTALASIITSIQLNVIVLLDVTLYSLVECLQHYGGICYLNFHRDEN